MKKRFIIFLTLVVLAGLVPTYHVKAETLASRFKGRILLQVQSHGEAWYVRIKDLKRYYMKDGAAAYAIMRFFSLGIADVDLAKIPKVSNTAEMKASTSACATSSLGNRFKGEILLQVQQHGEAWYVDPVKCRAIYMKDGAVAYEVMRFLGFGVFTRDLETIPDGGAVPGTSGSTITPPVAITPPACDLTARPRQFGNTAYYTGPLFDAHIHMPGLPEIKKLSCTFDKEKVKGAIGFYWSPPESQTLEKMLSEAQSIKTDSSEKIRLFLMPKSYSLQTLENIETTHKGLFTGYGELAFYERGDPSQSYYPQSPAEQQFLDLYVLAGKNNFVVMIHPNRGQETAVESLLQKNPNVKFYFHGDELESAIIGLMDKYSNVYFSIDAILSRDPSTGADALHASRTEEEYISKVKQNFDAILTGAVNDWKTKIEKHPDKFTWGTDRGGFSWHYDEEFSRLFEELSRTFIGRLDPTVQEKYAYKNAEALLQQ